MSSANNGAMENAPALPIIYIKAVNPGYTLDGQANVGEMIELARNDDSDTPLSLAGLKLGYTNSSGNSVDLLEFPENSWMTGEGLLLQLSGSSEPAHLSYLKTLAMKAGPLNLIRDGEVIDSVCWTGKDGCSAAFSSTKPTTLVRDVETLEFLHLENYEPSFDPDAYFEESIPDETPLRQCEKLEFTEVLSYFETTAREQFIELFNPTTEPVLLNGCQIKYKNNFLKLEGIIDPENYLAVYPTDFQLTKNPTTKNTIELYDTDGSLVDTLEYFNNQKKSASYARVGAGENGEAVWRITFVSTPGAENILAENPSCPDGKVLNPATGNCIKIAVVEEKTCKAGYYLNPATGRCKKYQVTTTKTCQEGYYLNPLTGRCKKLVTNTGADFPVQAENFQETSNFSAFGALVAVILVGVGYMIFQFRTQLKRLFGKVFRSFHRKRRL